MKGKKERKKIVKPNKMQKRNQMYNKGFHNELLKFLEKNLHVNKGKD
jgi:hypothetical protein